MLHPSFSFNLGRFPRVTVFVIFILLVACGSPVLAPANTPTLTQIPTQTALPTVSPTPQPSYLYLIAPSSTDATYLDQVQTLLRDTAQSNDLTFEMQTDLTETELKQQSVRLVVVVSTGLDLPSLANAAPQTQFLAIGYPDLSPQNNLSIIKTQAYRPDWEGFLAGFLAATVTQEWRVGIVANDATVEGKAAKNGFGNGVKFMCGLCQPLYPPFPIPTYPLYYSLNETSAQGDVDAGVALFQEWAVKTVYLYQPKEEWITTFGAAGFNLISDQIPSETLKVQWVASIQANDPIAELQNILPMVLNGKGGQVSSTGITLTDTNEELISPGRQAYVREMLSTLLAGQIDSGVDPTTGELY